MCPYYDQTRGRCKLYDSYPTDYTKRALCMEYEKRYTQCANYEEKKRQGALKPPSSYN